MKRFKTCLICSNNFIQKQRKVLCYRKHFYKCPNCEKLFEIKTWTDLKKLIGHRVVLKYPFKIIFENSQYIIFSYELINQQKWDVVCPKCRSDNEDILKKLMIQRQQKTNIEKFGEKCSLNNPQIKEKAIETLKQNYGVDNPLKSNIIKEKMKINYFNKTGFYHPLQNPIIREKIIKSWIKIYNCFHPMKNEVIKNKVKNTVLENWGVENVFQSEKIKEKIRNNYFRKTGYYNPSQNPLTREKIIHTWINNYGVNHPSKSAIIQNKIKNTCQEKYGVSSIFQSEKIKAKIRKTFNKKYGVDYPSQVREIRLKQIKTMKKNGKNSSWEDYFFKSLISFGLVENIDFFREYKSQRYPFYCDFYFPKYDLFLEINGYWFHNDHLFDINNYNDIFILIKWLNKINSLKSAYISAISTWVCRDYFKAETAKNNCLNYIILWNKTDISNFLSIFSLFL